MSLTRREMLALPLATTLLGQPQAWQTTIARFRGVHPRMYFDTARLTQIRGSLDTDYKEIWDAIRRDARSFRGVTPPVYITPAPGTDDEFWQRSNGDRMFLMALAWLLSGDSTLLAGCKRWVLASCSYPTWGTGDRLNADLAAAHQISGLAAVYDWLFDVLDGDTLTIIRKTFA
jgi:hypothetical protein